jgi:hypothetical protein
MKSFPRSLIIREIQINITIRYHLTSVKMSVDKKTKDKKFQQGCEETVVETSM